MQLAELARYPVKSLRGSSLHSAVVEARGLAGDRRWMVVDAAMRFTTRREVPDMALIDVDVGDGGITLRHPRLGACVATVPDGDTPTRDAVVWRDTVSVRLGNAAADAFLSEALGRSVRLAYQHDESRRAILPDFSQPGDHVSLADGFPLLLTTRASLAALNERLATPVLMARFRPNLVIAGAEPWAEDTWRRIRVGAVTLRIARASARCIVVTQQPLSGERLEGNEPLTTLRAMGRVNEDGVLFGQNAIADAPGTVRIGDPVEVLD